MRRIIVSVAALVMSALTRTEAATCSIPTACYLASNDGAGAGIEGLSSGSYGVWGITTFNATSSGTRGYGVYGQDRSTNKGRLDYGVLGSSTYGIGASGVSTYSYGVTGISRSGYGSYGQSASQSGVLGVSSFANPATLGSVAGVLGVASSTGTSQNLAGVTGKTNGGGFGVVGIGSSIGGSGGVRGVSTSGGPAISANATGAGPGVSATTDSGFGLQVTTNSGQGLYVFSGTGDGAFIETRDLDNGAEEGAAIGNDTGTSIDSYGGTIAVLARTQSGYGFVVSDSSGTKKVFSVDASGNVLYHGTIGGFARAAGGRETTAYAAKTTAPTLEDVGTAQLVAGSATVAFGSEFAASLDPGENYHVFLTPDGDTRGLYVATKTARGFVVRETQGGRGTFAFDYRIVGTALGDVGKRTAFVERGHEPGQPTVGPWRHPFTPKRSD